MADAFLATVKATLSSEAAPLVQDRVNDLENGNFHGLFSNELARDLLGLEDGEATTSIKFSDYPDWNDYIFRRLNVLASTKYREFSLETSQVYTQHLFFLIAVAALQTFVQVNITGPPLSYSTANLLFAPEIAQTDKALRGMRARLVASLGVDGIAAYRLAFYPELLCLADIILTAPAIRKSIKAAYWAKLRVDMLHQRLLSERSPTLEDQIFVGLRQSWDLISVSSLHEDHKRQATIELHLEQAAINLHYGFDKKAREDLDAASRLTGLRYALTGRLGKRTKFQEKETSQLLVLAKSHGAAARDCSKEQAMEGSREEQPQVQDNPPGSRAQPATLNLNDDTLLESISFMPKPKSSGRPGIVDEPDLPSELLSVDPNNQPQLAPYDSIVLLHLASSITASSPVDGITREETLPYALRVLEGGSSNWQIYTEALLVRSRVEGYKSRTVERGLLQLQTLVDQVISDTSGEALQDNDTTATANEEKQTTFLRRPQTSDSAPTSERLRYVHLLSAPTRWELEIELASRWTSMGGLRTALEIYERLEMWPEAALCWASTDREDKAKQIIKSLLNHPSAGENAQVANEESESWDGPARAPPPGDAPRLYCILGDIDRDPTMWQKAWEVSNGRYARAQRSLGRYYMAQREADQAAEAYAKSLKVSQLNGSSWFAYGCCLLELSRFQEAVEAFARTVQLDDEDAEAWSNLAAALVKRGPRVSTHGAGDTHISERSEQKGDEDNDTPATPAVDPQQHLRDALRAFKRAATLKQDSPRIYDNVLTVAAALDPPAYSDIIAAQSAIIRLRGKVAGESCVDESIVDALVRHVVSTYPSPSSTILGNAETSDATSAMTAFESTQRPGTLPALVTSLVVNDIVPLITRSPRLWSTFATLSLWRNRPASALEAHEKAWRIVIAQDRWENGDAKQWAEVVEATLDLVDAYESLGPVARTEGLGAGSGEVVAKDWRFKARSAIKSVMGRGKAVWEDGETWTRLEERLRDLKGVAVDAL